MSFSLSCRDEDMPVGDGPAQNWSVCAQLASY